MDRVRIAPESAFATERAITDAKVAGDLSVVDNRVCVGGVPVVYSARSLAALRAAEEKRARRRQRR